ncbi:MAG: Rne/Rng family ribonuclease, partial [Pseudomonadota bacterium]
DIPGMDVVDLRDEDDTGEAIPAGEASSPMERVPETPVEEPAEAEPADAEVSEAPGKTADSAESEAPDVAGEQAEAETPDKSTPAEGGEESSGEDDEEEPYVAADDASDRDETIESVAEEDVAEEIRVPRRPKPRRYKIQEVVKVRQILLVQVVKEERGNKGAALTTYLSLAGRYCVLMPNTARGGGISRKITNAADRKKLKEIASEIDVPKGAGLIVRTAGAKRTKTEIKRDYEYLQRLWEQIRELTLKSIAPAKIYEEGNLIKRSIRDLYNREIDEVMVEGDAGYRTAKDFMKMIMPSHAKNVKPYVEPMPLFARYQVESYLGGMFNPTVQLKSGGYIVIGVTEALVAIDVNSGRATKEGSIEDTALKTNLEAADEVARQLRLRDLAGLIVIDFIDMEERKNNSAVEKRLKDRLKTDRARIQVGRISGFGLLEMSRQRLRPGMLEATTQPCPHCHGTGLVRSDDSLGLTILRQIEEEGTRRKSREVLVKAPVGIVNFLVNQKREHIAGIEARYGMAVRIEGDPFLISPDFAIEKFKTATRVVKDAAPVVSADASLMSDFDVAEEVDEAEAPEAHDAEAGDGQETGRKKRRRRRRRRGGSGADQKPEAGAVEASPEEQTETATEALDVPPEQEAVAESEVSEEAPKKKARSRRRKSSNSEAPDVATDEPAPENASGSEPDQEPDAKPKRTRSRRRKKTEEDVGVEPASPVSPAEALEDPAPDVEAQPSETDASVSVTDPQPVPEAEAEPAAEPDRVPEMAEAAAEPAADVPPKPRRRGWWSIGR